MTGFEGGLICGFAMGVVVMSWTACLAFHYCATANARIASENYLKAQLREISEPGTEGSGTGSSSE